MTDSTSYVLQGSAQEHLKILSSMQIFFDELLELEKELFTTGRYYHENQIDMRLTQPLTVLL